MVRRGVTWVVLGVSAIAAPAFGQSYRIAEVPRPDECCRYKVETKVEGHITATSGERVEKKPLLVVNSLDAVTRTLRVENGSVLKSAWHYDRAISDVSFAGSKFQKSLPEGKRLIVRSVKEGRETAYSPAGPLSRDEFELVTDHFDAAALIGLLPGKEVEVGAEWEPNPKTVQTLCSFDGLISKDVKVKFAGVASGVAKLTVTGKASGIETGASVNLDINAEVSFDLLSNRLTSASWQQMDKRDSGPVGPPLEVKVVTTVSREVLGEEPKTLSDVALVAVPEGEPEGALTRLRFEHAGGKYRFLYGRGWHVVSQTNSHVTMRLLDRGDFIAQATVATWEKAQPGEHLSPDDLLRLTTATPGWEMDQLIDQGEIASAEEGRWVYRVTARGTSYGVEVVQNVFAIAGPKGDQAIVTFIMKPGNVAKVGTRDLALVQSIEFGK